MSSHYLGKICRIRHTQWLPTQEMIDELGPKAWESTEENIARGVVSLPKDTLVLVKVEDTDKQSCLCQDLRDSDKWDGDGERWVDFTCLDSDPKLTTTTPHYQGMTRIDAGTEVIQGFLAFPQNTSFVLHGILQKVDQVLFTEYDSMGISTNPMRQFAYPVQLLKGEKR